MQIKPQYAKEDLISVARSAQFKQDYLLNKQFFLYFLKTRLLGKTFDKHRDLKYIEDGYNDYYAKSNDDWVKERESRKDFLKYQNKRINTTGWFLYKMYNQALTQVLNQLSFDNLLEVGSGRGKNLLYQSLYFPEKHITGLEYSKQGVTNTKKLLQAPPKLLIDRIDSLVDRNKISINNVNVLQGNAFQLPFFDKEIDISYTILVLEQMPHEYQKALSEMVRVTKKYCIFIEPFKESNNWRGRLYLEAKDYFRFSYKKFKAFGLEPVYFSNDLPQKLKFGAGILVAKVK
ncbi:class I SAM-dependent methyltransferase [Flavobacteriaceae bacterium PRS1]|nr:class I SAM-dependent methyltransferase [Flavobacteriaceae bacterium PRS1]